MNINIHGRRNRDIWNWKNRRCRVAEIWKSMWSLISRLTAAATEAFLSYCYYRLFMTVLLRRGWKSLQPRESCLAEYLRIGKMCTHVSVSTHAPLYGSSIRSVYTRREARKPRCSYILLWTILFFVFLLSAFLQRF